MESTGFLIKSFDPAMTFSNFIEGESNKLAKAMALAVCKNPGKSYNPLYIYGKRGVGKSHLLNAIANHLKKNGLRVIAGRYGKNEEGRSSETKSADAIIIDDLPLIECPDLAFLKKFVAEGGQLVVSGPVSPDKLPLSLSDFINECGKSADIQPPEEELRIAILKARTESEGIELADDVAGFLAHHVRENIASLIGALHRVIAVSSLGGQKISRFSAIEALKDYIWTPEENHDIE